jgi:hypothetical protein
MHISRVEERARTGQGSRAAGQSRGAGERAVMQDNKEVHLGRKAIEQKGSKAVGQLCSWATSQRRGKAIGPQGSWAARQ